MAHKLNKPLSIILILMMLMGTTLAININAVADGGTLSLICPDRDDFAEGTKVRFGIESTGTDIIASYKLMSSVDGISYTEVGTYDGESEYVTVTTGVTQKYYMLKAYDEVDNELASSDAVVFGGKRESVRSTIWNLDFEDKNLSVISSGLNRYLSSDGSNAIKSNGDTMGMHVGDEDNTITIENTSSVESGKNGKSLAFARNGNAGNCQINGGWAKVSSGIAVYSVDVATDSYGNRTLLTGASTKADGGNQWFPMVEMRDDGNVVAYLRSQSSAHSAPGVRACQYDGLNYVLLGTYETNKWYNVKYVMNIENGTLDIYFNDVYMATDFDRVSSSITPARFTLSNSATDGVLYVDNIKAYTVEHITINPGLSLQCDASGKSLPQGTKVKLDITVTDMEDAERIELLQSTEGGEYTVIESFCAENVSTYVELPRFGGLYKAVAYDNRDEIIKETDVLELSANPVVLDETLWDIDFEDEKFTSSAEYRYLCDKTGTALSMSHSSATSSLTAHTGSLENDITVEYSGDELHGNAVKLKVVDDKQVQFNEFRARTMGGTVIGEWDIKFDSFPDNSSSLTALLMEADVAHDGSGSSEKPSGSIVLGYNGGKPYFSDGTDYFEPVEPGVWYNLKVYTDLDNSVSTFLIDGKLAFSKSFDSSLVWTEKYIVRMGKAAGCELWIDNFKVQRATVISVPKIVNITNDENSLYIEFAQKIDEDVFYGADGKIYNISVEYDDNVLDFVSCESTDNPNVLRFVSDKKIYTSVPLSVEVTVPYNNGETMKCTDVYTAPSSEFDVTDVTASYNGSAYSIEATLCNTSGVKKSAVMVAVFYDAGGNTVAVRPSIVQDDVVTGSKITLSGSVKADKMHIYFIDNWSSSKAIKNVIYKK